MRATVRRSRIHQPSATSTRKLAYTRGISLWNPTKMSPANNATSGNKNATRRSLITAPPKSAIAPTGVKFHGCGMTRRIAASAIITSTKNVRNSKVSCSILSLFMFSRLQRQQIAKNKGIAFHHFARLKGNRALKNRTIEYKRVELTVFATRIGTGWQVSKEGLVELAPGKTVRQNFPVHADRDRAKSRGMKMPNQFVRIPFPDRKKRRHADSREILLPIRTQILEKDVAKRDRPDSLRIVVAHRRFHAFFVQRISAFRRDSNLMKRQIDRFRLLVKQLPAN